MPGRAGSAGDPVARGGRGAAAGPALGTARVAAPPQGGLTVASAPRPEARQAAAAPSAGNGGAGWEAVGRRDHTRRSTASISSVPIAARPYQRELVDRGERAERPA